MFMRNFHKIFLFAITLIILPSSVLAGNGLSFKPMFWHKAELKAINGTNLIVTVKDKEYQVQVIDKTKLIRRWGAKSNLGEFKINDILQIQGRREGDSIINPRLIRNLSILKKKTTFTGRIENLDAANYKFNLKNKNNGLIVVTFSDTTKILDKRVAKSPADLMVGAEVIASGLWDKNNKTLSEVSQIVIMPIVKK